jgi:hypothetical protein
MMPAGCQLCAAFGVERKNSQEPGVVLADASVLVGASSLDYVGAGGHPLDKCANLQPVGTVLQNTYWRRFRPCARQSLLVGQEIERVPGRVVRFHGSFGIHWGVVDKVVPFIRTPTKQPPIVRLCHDSESVMLDSV